jgi:hypothetical protein
MTRQTAERMGVPFEQFMEAVAAQTPLRRVGQPEDVAGTIAYLCSDDASYVSGQVIYVAGGPTARPEPPESTRVDSCRHTHSSRLRAIFVTAFGQTWLSRVSRRV